ncbi:MAG: oligosaccharide flippase family protein [Epulopiscium sp.]|nr:oligosaccharide flippase family protein [Candidatus Epulonipiscium sp.]
MKKYKYLFKNIGLLTISNFGSKILIFLLVPLYTSVLSTAEYGSYDIVHTTINLLIPILTLNISDSVIRFSIDKENNPQKVFSIGLSVVVKAWLAFLLVIIINNIFNIIPVLKTYSRYMVLLFLVISLYQLCSQFARGTDRIVDLSIAGIVNSFTMISFNILFLLYFKLGIAGFFMANILSSLIAVIYFIIRLKIYKYIIKIKNSDTMIKDMKNYSRPLTLNSISWWVTNASDRYVVTWMCGIAVNGIYSVAYKIPSIMNVFQSIFLQAWQISAVKSFDNKDKEGFFSQIYNMYNFSMVIICSLMIILIKFIASIMFANNFYDAWVFVPILLISNVFGAMSGFIGGVFSAVKDTKIYSYSTTIGAIINIILNIILIKFYGAIGAAIATTVSYFVVWVIRIINARKYILLKLYIKRDLLVYFILVLQAIFIIYASTIKVYVIELVMFIIIIFLYRSEIKKILKKLNYVVLYRKKL